MPDITIIPADREETPQTLAQLAGGVSFDIGRGGLAGFFPYPQQSGILAR